LRLDGGRRVSGPVMTMDVMPTALSVAGADRLPPSHGHDLALYLDDDRDAHPVSFGETGRSFFPNNSRRAGVTGTWVKLVSDFISDGLEATVAPSMRETVAAVADLVAEQSFKGAGVSMTAVAKKLGLDKISASRRVWVAIKRGYLENLENYKGRSAKVILGDPLPDDVEILPHPDKLADDRCTVAA
jgi:hypothetical protein